MMNDTDAQVDSPPYSLEGQRAYLLILARTHLNPRFQGKVDASDVVQQAMLLAHQRKAQFRGGTEAEWRGWLRAILANCLAGVGRRFATERRDIRRERSISEPVEPGLDESAAGLDDWLAAADSSPSQRAQREEHLGRLIEMLEELPDDQRTAVVLHHLRRRTVAEIAAEMGRSKPAVVGLLFRGMKRLRDRFGAGDDT